MKYYFSCFLFFNSIISILSVIPEWNLEKTGDNLLNSESNEHNYVIIERLMYNVFLKMTRKVYKNDGVVNYTNHVYMSNHMVNIQERDVDFDFVESFYLIGDNYGDYIVCPKGPYHPYNLNKGEYITINGFEKKGLKDWDLKCYKHENNGETFLLVFYLLNGEINFFHSIYGNYDWGHMNQDFASELYDYKITDSYYYSGKEREYVMMPLMKNGNFLALIGKVAVLKSDKRDYFTPDESMKIDICSIKKYTQAYYSNSSNSFYYITYNDINDFISGYVSTTNTDITINNYNWADIKKNNESPFEFIEKEFEIEAMNIMLYNRFVYYKIRDKNNSEKIYHGIFDIIKNKVIFNTNEIINYFIPYSNLAMLAITPTSAYKICFYKNNGECAEECSEGYKYDVDGNTCNSSSDCDDNKITLIPSGICIDSCDERYYIKKDGKCGLCKDFNLGDKSYKLVNGTECIEFNQESMEFFNEDLKLLKCKENYLFKNNDCKKKCYELCEEGECTEYSDNENDQKCISCIDNYYLENGNCKDSCSERYGIVGNECIMCEDKFCESFEKNTCNCLKCSNGYYYNSSNLCDHCDLSCLKCEGLSDNCTECHKNNSFLFNNKCINCSSNCLYKDADNCKCKECDKGFYVEDFLCENCADNCDKCTNKKNCEKCSDNYFVNSQGNCSPCSLNCKEKEDDNCKCKVCNDGYFLKDSDCKACNSDCETCEGNSDNCTNCKKHYFFNNEKKCEECSLNCENCFNKNDNCTSCKDSKYLNKENKCEDCNIKCKTCDSGGTEVNDHCLSCYNDSESQYKYLAFYGNNQTCVDNCELIGMELDIVNKICKPLKNSTEAGDKPNNNGNDYLLWIFIAIISILLIIITICIIKKCCCDKGSTNYFEEISTDLDEKELIN